MIRSSARPRWLAAILLAWIATSTQFATAAVIPVWTTPDHTAVTLPAGGNARFRVEGYVTGDFDAMLIMDNSLSMGFAIPANVPAARNGGRQRGDWALDGADDLIDALADTVGLGLTKFSATSELLSEVADLGPSDAAPSHRAALKALLRTLTRQDSGTNIANAITFAANQLLNRPNPGDSLHLVLVTDGQPTAGNARTATLDALARGIDSVNTIALPGADSAYLQEIAQMGNGVFVDGTDLTLLLERFRTILDEAETLARLDIELPDGSLIENVAVDLEGMFAVEGLIAEGDNVFRAHATSSLGNVVVRDLHVMGHAVPEPATAVLILFCIGTRFALVRGRRLLRRSSLR